MTQSRTDKSDAAIDFVYRAFATDQRNFRAADIQCDRKFTCNMATAIATADLAVLFVDARNGALLQASTLRQSRIVAMMSVWHVVLAITMMELVGFDKAIFNAIMADYSRFATGLGITSVQLIPLVGPGWRQRDTA